MDLKMDERIKSIIVKVGTAGVTTKDNIRREVIKQLACGCYQLLKFGKSVAIVTSGAIALGRRETNSKYRKNESLQEKQRYASIGQPFLMQAYREEFKKYGIRVAQLLLTSNDFNDKKRLDNLKATYYELRKNKDMAIFNENDAVATKEITFGDNDLLAAYLIKGLNIDLLLNLIVYDGLLRKGKIVKIANSFNVADYDRLESEIREGRGGLESKLQAANITTNAGKVFILGNIKYNLLEIVGGKKPSTKFLPYNKKIKNV